MTMNNKIQELSQKLTDECKKQNKKCTITIIDLDKSSHAKVISFVANRVAELFCIRLEDIKNRRRTLSQREAKKMIVFLLVNRLSIPIKDVSDYLGISSQSISYTSLNPYGIYRIDNYENFVYKIENELKEKLYLSS